MIFSKCLTFPIELLQNRLINVDFYQERRERCQNINNYFLRVIKFGPKLLIKRCMVKFGRNISFEKTFKKKKK